MKILAIEASGLVASAAVAEDELIKTEFTVNNGLTHSETLLPMIREMMKLSGLELQGIDAVAVSAGPGSFTGLRIGAATAKGLALALNRPIIRVSTLRAMAFGISTFSDAVICPVMDARRGQVYCAAYRCGIGVVTEGARDIHEYLQMLSGLEDAGDAEFVFLGDGVPVHTDTICAELDREIVFAGAEFNRQRAAGTAALGTALYRTWLHAHGLTAEEVRRLGADAIDCYDETVMLSDDFVPQYYRQTQAEREMAAGLLEDAGQHSLKKMQEKDMRRRPER